MVSPTTAMEGFGQVPTFDFILHQQLKDFGVLNETHHQHAQRFSHVDGMLLGMLLDNCQRLHHGIIRV